MVTSNGAGPLPGHPSLSCDARDESESSPHGLGRQAGPLHGASARRLRSRAAPLLPLATSGQPRATDVLRGLRAGAHHRHGLSREPRAVCPRPACSLGPAGVPAPARPAHCQPRPVLLRAALVASPGNGSARFRSVSVRPVVRPTSTRRVPDRWQVLGRDRQAFTELQPGGGVGRPRPMPGKQEPRGRPTGRRQWESAPRPGRQAYSPRTPLGLCGFAPVSGICGSEQGSITVS